MYKIIPVLITSLFLSPAFVAAGCFEVDEVFKPEVITLAPACFEVKVVNDCGAYIAYATNECDQNYIYSEFGSVREVVVSNKPGSGGLFGTKLTSFGRISSEQGVLYAQDDSSQSYDITFTLKRISGSHLQDFWLFYAGLGMVLITVVVIVLSYFQRRRIGEKK